MCPSRIPTTSPVAWSAAWLPTAAPGMYSDQWTAGVSATAWSALLATFAIPVSPLFHNIDSYISHVSVWDSVAITSGQVTAHYNALIAGSQTNYETVVLADSPDSAWFLTETSGIIAADATGGGNTGTYAQWIPIFSQTSFAGLGFLSVYNGMIVVSGEPVRVGDKMFIGLNIDPFPSPSVAVTSITDTQGNTWSAVTPFLTFTNAGGRQALIQMWSATIGTPISIGGTLSFTITFNGGVGNVDPSQIWGFFVQSISPVNATSTAFGSGSTWNSGGITTGAAAEFFLSMTGALNSLVGVAAPFVEVVGTSGGNNSAIASAVAQGFVVDQWTDATATNYAVALAAFDIPNGMTLNDMVTISVGFDTGFLSTVGSGIYPVPAGFATSIELIIGAYDASFNPIIVDAMPLTANTTLVIT